MSEENSNLPPSRLGEAIGRVDRALNVLEQATMAQQVDQERSERNEQHLQLVVNENESLKKEQEELNKAIDMLQGQYDDLQQVASNIYGKLDDSVRRITKIIGN